MPSIHFSKVVILESLAVGKTGRQLYEDLRVINIQKNLNIDISYVEVNSKQVLLDQLVFLKEDAERGAWPILHIECHGLKDTTGISLASDESISWAELKPYFTGINIATECNLLIVMAACYGGHIVQIIQPVERAPCLALLSPTKEIYPDEILLPLTAFYTELFSSLNLNAALNQLHACQITEGGYYFETAPSFFRSVYIGYIKGSIEQKALKVKRRALNIYMELKNVGVAVTGGIGAIKKMLKQSQPEFFKSYYEKFFMVDMYPKNRSRFNIKYAELHEEAMRSQ